ncbi:MAG: hypothetical protein L6R40_005737 [Gallowayella cf. fulva]|nr:MAG: hypothetical protein L6R40_005737 [Xanthomendoza cf. fulva]
MPSSRRTSSRRSKSQQVDPIVSPLGDLDPSFRAIRALNGQPGAGLEPDVIPAIIMDLNGNSLRTPVPVLPTPGTDDAREPLASQGHLRRCFSARLERLMQAVGRRQRIRFAPSENKQDVNIIVTKANGSEAGSPQSVTDQIAAHPESWGRIIRPYEYVGLQSPDFSSSGDGAFWGRDRPTLHDSAQASGLAETDTLLDIGFGRVRVRSQIITEDDRQALQQRILNKIAEISGEASKASKFAGCDAEEVKKSKTSVIADYSNKTGEQTVDPRRVYTIGIDGEERCSAISPIPLDYRKLGRMETPSVGSSSTTSALSSPLMRMSKWKPPRMRETGETDEDRLPTSPIATTDAWVSERSNEQSSGELTEEEDDQLKRVERNKKVSLWLHRVKNALKGSKGSPAKKVGLAASISRDRLVKSPEGIEEQISGRLDKALADVTNVRQLSNLGRNSFAQEKVRQILAGLENRKKHRAANAPKVLPRQTAQDLPPATAASKASGTPSTVKGIEKEEELHPDIAFSLARLEGRVLPRPTSPFQVRRFRGDNSSYGSDVEVEIASSRLMCPQPRRPDHEDIVGPWTAPLEEAVEAGFECILEAPEEVE